MGPFKCSECGIWWTGPEHRCRSVVDSTGTFVIRPYTPDTTETSSTTCAPWCPICQGFHIPGAGPCTATYCVTS